MMGWIRRNWKDPVWSNVFAGLIIAAILAVLSFIITFIYSQAKKIPFQEIYNCLKSKRVEISLLLILISAFIFLVLIILLAYYGVIRFQINHLKIYNREKIKQILDDQWLCEYSNGQDNGAEVAKILDGNKYFIRDDLIFILTDITYDEDNSTIAWTKTQYPFKTKHSRELLYIRDNSLLEGEDDIGYRITYKRMRS